MSCTHCWPPEPATRTRWGWVKALLHSVYDQPDAASVHAQSDRVIDALAGKLPTVAGHLDTARADILACTKIKDATLTGSIART